METIRSMFKKNGTFFTGLIAATVLIVGLTIANNPSQWWMGFVAVGGLGIVAFLFLNARVVFKVTASILVLLFSIVFIVELMPMIDPFGGGAVFWILLTVALYLVALTYSYYRPSGRSRWTRLVWALLLSFVATMSITVAGLEVAYASLIGASLGLGMFILRYSYTKHQRGMARKMPQNVYSEKLMSIFKRSTNSQVIDLFTFKSRGLRKLFKKNATEEADQIALQTGGILVYGNGNKITDEKMLEQDQRAYFLYPINMDQKFGLGNKNELAYKTNPISYWLTHLVYTQVPVWRVKGAPVLLVLVDLQNSNGDKPKVIASRSVDSSHVEPIGVIPLGKISKSKDPFEYLTKAFGDEVLPPLKSAHVAALTALKQKNDDATTTISVPATTA